MKGLGVAGLVLAVMAVAAPTTAHPVPFTYLDIQFQPGALDVTLVAHAFDVGHDLGLDPGQLLDPSVLQSQSAKIAALVNGRLFLDADGRRLGAAVWGAPEALGERQSVKLQAHYDLARAIGKLTVNARLFPYDPAHQTFVNFYEKETIATQAILDARRTRFEYFGGSGRGILAVVRRFLSDGVRHIVVGPEHLLFLTGLSLLGGTFRRLIVLVSAFALAQFVTLSLAALHVLTPPARFIEPAIALTIVYLGVDNLLVRDGRDMRAWIALAFGLIHGFGFAGVLREMDLPRRALGWSLVSFTVGVEIGHLVVVVAIASSLAALRSRMTWADRYLAVAGSVAVMVAGTFWFIQRVFFAGRVS